MRNFKIYAIFLIAAVAFSLTSCSSSSSSPGNAVVKTYDFMKNKDFDKASKMYVTKKGEAFSEEDAKKMEGLVAMAYEQWQKKDGIKNIEITEETIEEDGNSAKVKFIIHFNNGETDNENANLSKKDGKWFLQV